MTLARHIGASEGAVSNPMKALGPDFQRYRELLGLFERLHRLMLDVIKDDFERLAIADLSAVQALLIYNVGDHRVSAGELRSRGYYQGSNVSYNLKKLVASGYLLHERAESDKRAVRISLTPKGREVRDLVEELFAKHTSRLLQSDVERQSFDQAISLLKQVERFWGEEIRFIY